MKVLDIYKYYVLNVTSSKARDDKAKRLVKKNVEAS